MNITKIMNAVSLLMYWIASVLLMFIMLIICLDVFLRTLFNITGGALDFTIAGTIEMVRFGLLFAMLLAFPYAVDKGQIIVDIFTEQMSVRRRDILDGLYLTGFGGFAGLLCWRFGEAAHVAMLTGEKTQDLMWSMEWLYGPAAIILALVAMQSVLAGIRLLTHREHHQEVHV